VPATAAAQTSAPLAVPSGHRAVAGGEVPAGVGDCPYVFIPGVGHLDYVCGASKSTTMLAARIEPKPLVVFDGDQGIVKRLPPECDQVCVLDSPNAMLGGIRGAVIVRKLGFLWAWLRYVFRLRRVLKGCRARLVYTCNGATFLAYPAIAMLRLKWVIGVRGGIRNSWKWRFVIRKSDRTCVLSHQMKQELVDWFPAADRDHVGQRITVLYNGVDLEAFKFSATGRQWIRERMGLGADAICILYAAAFRPWKGQLAFLQRTVPDLLSHPAATGGRIHVVFLGGATEAKDQDYLDQCQQFANTQGWDQQIHFVGFDTEVIPWYSAADLVVLASEHEGMPRCIIEAMSCERPGVCFRVSSVDELLTANGAGYVLDQGDYRGLCQVLLKLSDDAELREQMGSRGRAFASSELDIHHVTTSYQRLFSQLVQGRRSNASEPMRKGG